MFKNNNTQNTTQHATLCGFMEESGEVGDVLFRMELVAHLNICTVEFFISMATVNVVIVYRLIVSNPTLLSSAQLLYPAQHRHQRIYSILR